MPSGYNDVGYETLTVTSATAVALTGATGAKSYVGYLETAQIRLRGDGTDPTSTEGILMQVGDRLVLSESEIRRMKFIRTGGVDGVLKGNFYTMEPEVLGL